MKFKEAEQVELNGKSHLTRGAWIEIWTVRLIAGNLGGRTSHEVRGLKYKAAVVVQKQDYVAPHTRCVD